MYHFYIYFDITFKVENITSKVENILFSDNRLFSRLTICHWTYFDLLTNFKHIFFLSFNSIIEIAARDVILPSKIVSLDVSGD